MDKNMNKSAMTVSGIDDRIGIIEVRNRKVVDRVVVSSGDERVRLAKQATRLQAELHRLWKLRDSLAQVAVNGAVGRRGLTANTKVTGESR